MCKEYASLFCVSVGIRKRTVLERNLSSDCTGQSYTSPISPKGSIATGGWCHGQPTTLDYPPEPQPGPSGISDLPQALTLDVPVTPEAVRPFPKAPERSDSTRKQRPKIETCRLTEHERSIAMLQEKEKKKLEKIEKKKQAEQRKQEREEKKEKKKRTRGRKTQRALVRRR